MNSCFDAVSISCDSHHLSPPCLSDCKFKMFFCIFAPLMEKAPGFVFSHMYCLLCALFLLPARAQTTDATTKPLFVVAFFANHILPFLCTSLRRIFMVRGRRHLYPSTSRRNSRTHGHRYPPLFQKRGPRVTVIVVSRSLAFISQDSLTSAGFDC